MNNNLIYRDTIVTVVVDTVTSILCSVIVFIALGSIARSDGTDLQHLFTQGLQS